MKSFLFAALWLSLAAPVFSQTRHEVGLTLGRIAGTERGRASLGGGAAWQANYGVRLMGGARVALFGEVHLLASPQRLVASGDRTATRDVASLYVTPGVRVKFLPAGRVQPYFVLGGGYALHEHSVLNLGGGANAAPRTAGTGAFVYGGGVDVPVWRWAGLRMEIRDFVTGSPVLNVPASGRPHNVVVGGGATWRF